MIVHPSLMLVASIDEAEFNEEVALDVKRAFVHLAPTSVRRAPASEPACNTLAFKVNFSKKYWLDGDEGATEMWPIVKKWLAGKRYFVEENIGSFNKSRGDRGEQTVDYRKVELLLAGNVVRIAVEPAVALPLVEDIAEQVRGLANAGVFGDGAALDVEVPSSESLAAQVKAHLDAVAAQGDEDPADGNEQVPEPGPLTIDYGVWGVLMPDGTRRQYDAVRGTWL